MLLHIIFTLQWRKLGLRGLVPGAGYTLSKEGMAAVTLGSALLASSPTSGANIRQDAAPAPPPLWLEASSVRTSSRCHWHTPSHYRPVSHSPFSGTASDTETVECLAEIWAYQSPFFSVI